MHDYNTILGVIELRLSKVSYDSVQKRYRIGRSGIALIMNRYKDSGLSLDDLRQMPASKVVDLIYPKENLRHKDIPLPDFEKIHEQMIQMGKHADLSFLWIDYKKEHPNGYQLAQFYKLYRDFMVDTYGTSKTSMPVERIPGEKMYIDWVGDQPELLLDTTTGELRKVHIFTTTLGFSSLVYAEIFPDENEYSCAMKSHFRKFGNQMSGSGNHLCEFTRVMFYLDHIPLAWICHAQHQCL